MLPDAFSFVPAGTPVSEASGKPFEDSEAVAVGVTEDLPGDEARDGEAAGVDGSDEDGDGSCRGGGVGPLLGLDSYGFPFTQLSITVAGADLLLMKSLRQLSILTRSAT
jgi:hypothetical protein